MTVHDLKSWPPFYEHVEIGLKTFEIRRDDRRYQLGDILRLREWDPATEKYTGRETRQRVTYVMRGVDLPSYAFGLPPGFVAMAIEGADHAKTSLE